jgi:hypothetical protein
MAKPKTNVLVAIYNAAGKIADIPQADIVSLQLTDVLNGGSSSGSIVFDRPYNQIGALGYGFPVQVWFWPAGTTRPTDPWYSGYIVKFKQEQNDASGRVTIYTQGDMKLLDAGIVTQTIAPSVGGNPALDCAAYLQHIIAGNGSTFLGYQPPNFAAPIIPSSMFPLYANQFDATKLGAAIDTLTKQGRDSSGLLYTWFVRTTASLVRRVVVQPDQNPNTVSGLRFKMLFPGQWRSYATDTDYSNIVNVVAVYGGKDPVTGQQVYGVYQDPASITLLNGQAIQEKLSVPYLLSSTAAQNYASVHFALKAYPTAIGSFEILDPDPAIVSGTWLQLNEAPASASTGASYKQVRCGQVDFSFSGERVVQKIQTQSPAPFLDTAIYRMGLNVAAQAATAIRPLSISRQTLYIRQGGYVTGSASSPAKLALAAVDAVFPGLAGAAPLLVSAGALALTTLTDNTGSATNGQTGDGPFTISLTSAGAYVITKGPVPANSATQQNLVTATVVNGVPFPADARLLNGDPGMPVSAQAAGPQAITTLPITPTYPNGTGAAGFDALVHVQLTSEATKASPWLKKLELGAVAVGAANTTPVLIDRVDPNASGIYDFLYGQLSAPGPHQLFVRYTDGVLSSAWLLLGTTTSQPIDLGIVTRPVSGSAPAISLTAGFAFVDKTATSYDAQYTWTSDSANSRWANATGIAWDYRLHGSSGAFTPLETIPIVGGSGSNAAGSGTIPHLTVDPSAQWDLYGRYVTSAGSVSSRVLVGTTSVHSSTTVGTPPSSLPRIPVGFSMPATPATVSTIVDRIGYSLPGVNYGCTIAFTTDPAITPPGGTASGTAAWEAYLQPVRAVFGTTQWEIAGPPTSANTAGSYNLFYTVPKGNRYVMGFMGVDGFGGTTPVVTLYTTPSGVPRRTLGGSNESWPSGTTLSASGSVASYISGTPGSPGPVANVSLTLAITIPTTTPANPPLANLLTAFALVVQTAAAGATNGGTDTNYANWQEANYAAGSTLPTAMTCALTAGIAQNIGAVFFDANNQPTQVYPIATTQAQPISGTSMGSVGSELVDNGGGEAVVAGVPSGWYVQSNPVPALFTFSADPTSKVSGANSLLIRVNSSATIPTGTTAIAIQSNPLSLPANSRQISQSQMLAVAKNANPPAGVSFTADSFLRYFPTLADVTAGTNQVGADVSIQSLAPGVGFTGAASTLVPPAGAGYALVFIRVTAVNTTGSAVSSGANLYCDARWDNVSVIPAVMSGDAPPGQWGRGHLKPISGSPVFPITDAVVGTDGRIVFDLNHTAVQSTIASTPGADGLYTKPGMIAGRHLLGASSSDTAAVADSSGRVLIGRHAADVQLAQQRNYITDGRFIQGNYANNYGWTAYGPATMSNTGGAYTANGVTYSMPTVSYTGSFGGFYRLLRVKPGQTYTYACLGALLSGSAGTALRVLISNVGSTTQYNGSATAPAGTAGALYTAGAGASAVPLQTTTTLTWVPIIGTFTVPSGVSLIWFMVEAYGSTAGGSFSFFLPMFHEGGKTQDYVDGAPYDSDGFSTSSSPMKMLGAIVQPLTPTITLYWQDTSGNGTLFLIGVHGNGSSLPDKGTSSYTITWPDGSTSPFTSSLWWNVSLPGTYYFVFAYNSLTNALTCLYGPSTVSATAAQVAAAFQDYNTPITANCTVVATTGGSGTGGGGGSVGGHPPGGGGRITF